MVAIDNLSFSYPDGHIALQDISMAVQAGERVGLIGSNGAGKSTLLLQLNGILRGQGAIHVAGLELSDETIRHIRAHVGLVFQDPDDQLFSPTVFDDVAFGPLYMDLPEEEVLRRVTWALEQVQMGDFAQRQPHHLSLGERKKIAIATVLSMDPVVLALDEPSAGLDPEARDNLIALLNRLPQAMLIASHDLDFVRQTCSRAILLERGRVVRAFPTSELAASDAPVVQAS
jgi:cobalt/nickel transport system ATP-binding protein